MRRFPCWLVVVISLWGGTACSRSPAGLTATLILRNAKVWTVNGNQPQAQAVAILGESIARVGTNAEVDPLQGPTTRVLNLQGKLVVPGFNDSHVHFTRGGLNLLSVKLRDAGTPEEFARRIGEYARTLPKGEWILGGDWDHELWPGASLPTRALIDSLTPDNPVFVNRLDGHMSLANSLALKLGGITRATPAPKGGTIVSNSSGEPTGILKDAAMDLVARVIPSPTKEKLRKAILAALAEARRLGVTSVQDMPSAAELAAYQELQKAGELTVSIDCRFPLPEYKKLADLGIGPSFGCPWIRLGSLKGFADGSLGSTTALFFAPYDDAPNTSGLPAPMMFPEGNMSKLIKQADAARLQVTVHAIGDRANNLILNLFEEVQKGNPGWDRRFRIEHAQHLLPTDIPRFARLGIIASMQPYHVIDDGRWAEKRIGKERCKTTYAFRSLLDAGVHLAFGSDWFVAPLSPLLGIYAAVTRRTIDGKNPRGWYPEQRTTVAEAIKAYTWTSAYATFEEKIKGSIAPGMLADLAVLSDDILTIPPEQIEHTEVLYTIVSGKIVHEKGN